MDDFSYTLYKPHSATKLQFNNKSNKKNYFLHISNFNELITNLLKRAARKSSNTSEEGFSPLELDTPREAKPKLTDLLERTANKSSGASPLQPHGGIRSALKNKNGERKHDENKVSKVITNNKKLASQVRADSVKSNRSVESVIPEIKIIETGPTDNNTTSTSNNYDDIPANKSLKNHDKKYEKNESKINNIDSKNDKHTSNKRYPTNEEPRRKDNVVDRKQFKFPKQRNNNEDGDTETTLMHYGDSYESIPMSIRQMQEFMDNPADVIQTKENKTSVNERNQQQPATTSNNANKR